MLPGSDSHPAAPPATSPQKPETAAPSAAEEDMSSAMPPILSPRPSAAYMHVSSAPSHSPDAGGRIGTPHEGDDDEKRSATPGEAGNGSVPPSLLSPAFTPPSTPGTGAGTPNHRAARRPSIPVDSSDTHTGGTLRRPKLLDSLPEVNCVVRSRIPTVTGAEMYLHLYQNSVDNKEHLAIVFGSHIRSRSLFAPRPGESEMDRIIRGAYTGRLYPGRTTSHAPQSPPEPIPTPNTSTAPLVRIHSECYTGETAWSARCDCGEQLDEAARLMSLPGGGGVIIYLRQEGRGIGLSEKLKAYNLQDLGSDTVEANLLLRHPADARSYGLATAMLVDLGLGGPSGVSLLTNNPDKIRAVEGPNREVVVKERVPMVPLAWRSSTGLHGQKGVQGVEVGNYIRTKIEKMGHLLDLNSAT